MRLAVFIFLFVLPGCVSYPEFMDKKLEVTKTSYRLDGTVESVTVTEHTPSTMGQQAISNAKVDLVVPNCTFNMEALSEIGEVAFAMGMAAGIQMNPCLNGSVIASNQTNMFDKDIAQANAQSGITKALLRASVVGLAIDTAGDVLEAGFDASGNDYVIGDISQSSTFASNGGDGGPGGEGGLSTTETGDPIGGEGSEGGAAAAGGGASGNQLNIGDGNSTGIAGADAISSTGTKSGNGTIEDGDGVINRGSDESDNNVNAEVSLEVPVGVN